MMWPRRCIDAAGRYTIAPDNEADEVRQFDALPAWHRS
jgi:hypothetical protein